MPVDPSIPPQIDPGARQAETLANLNRRLAALEAVLQGGVVAQIPVVDALPTPGRQGRLLMLAIDSSIWKDDGTSWEVETTGGGGGGGGGAPALHASTHKSGGTDFLRLDELGAPTDLTVLNSSTTAHGLLRKLSNSASQYMDGTGAWSTPPSSGGSPFVNITTYGGVGDDTTVNDTPIANAIAALPAAGGIVYFPTGTYKYGNSIDCGLGVSLIGESIETTSLHYTGSAHAVNIGVPSQVTAPQACKNRVTDLTVTGPGAGTAGSIGVRVTKCLFPSLERVGAKNFETGFKFDGGDLWIASGHAAHIRTLNVKQGLLLTADSGKQVNDMTFLGSYFYGGGGETGAFGVKVEASCDTNHFFGTSVEGFTGTSAKGWWVTSGVVTGNFFCGTRAESCTTGFLLDTLSNNNLVIGHSSSFASPVSDTGYANQIIQKSQFRRSTRYMAFASTITPDAADGEIKEIDVLTGPVTIANPTNPAHGLELSFLFKQDSTGGRVITWGSKYRINWTPDTGAFKRNTARFVYNANFDLWMCMGAQTGLAA